MKFKVEVNKSAEILKWLVAASWAVVEWQSSWICSVEMRLVYFFIIYIIHELNELATLGLS